jgi:hypothetical protein
MTKSLLPFIALGFTTLQLAIAPAAQGQLSPYDSQPSAVREVPSVLTTSKPATDWTGRNAASKGLFPAAPTNQAALRQVQFAMTTDDLWTPEGAITGAGTDLISPGASAVSPGDRTDCRWSFDGANVWNCKIKPLSKYAPPLRNTLLRLWPLHGKSGN